MLCNDGNPCTADSCCDAVIGCVFSNNGNICDDGNGCTGGDICSNGQCKGALGCSVNGQCLPGAQNTVCAWNLRQCTDKQVFFTNQHRFYPTRPPRLQPDADRLVPNRPKGPIRGAHQFQTTSRDRRTAEIAAKFFQAFAVKRCDRAVGVQGIAIGLTAITPIFANFQRAFAKFDLLRFSRIFAVSLEAKHGIAEKRGQRRIALALRFRRALKRVRQFGDLAVDAFEDIYVVSGLD